MTLFHTLRGRLLLLLLLTVAPAFSLMVYSSLEWRNQDAQLVKDNVLRLSKFIANNMDRDFLATRALLTGVSKFPGVAEGDLTRCQSMFDLVVKESPLYENLGMIDPAGRVVYSAIPFEPEKGIPNLPWFRDILEKKAMKVSSHYLYPKIRKPTVHVGYPVLSKNGEVQSILFASLGTAWITDLAKEAELPATAALTVSSANGEILARFPDPEKWVGTVQTNLLVSRLETPAHGIIESMGVDGVPRLYAYTKLTQADLFIRIGMGRETVYAAANRVLLRNLAVYGLVALLVVALAWFGAHALVIHPIHSLVKATERVANGDLRARVLTSDRGELGQLASSFNQMTESLEWRDAQLREADVGYSKILGEITERQPGWPKEQRPLNGPESPDPDGNQP